MIDAVKVLRDPVKILGLSKEELVVLIGETEQIIEELEAQRVEARKILCGKVSDDGEIIAGKAVGKQKYYNFDIELEEARELGATKIIPEKEKIDTAILKQLVLKGSKIKHTVSERVVIRDIDPDSIGVDPDSIGVDPDDEEEKK